MKKALGLVLLVTFFIGAISAWTFFEQENRHRDELERLGRPRLLARLTVVGRIQQPADGERLTIVEVVQPGPEGEERSAFKCALEGLEALLADGPDGKPEPVEPGATYNLILNADGELRLVPASSASE